MKINIRFLEWVSFHASMTMSNLAVISALFGLWKIYLGIMFLYLVSLLFVSDGVARSRKQMEFEILLNSGKPAKGRFGGD